MKRTALGALVLAFAGSAWAQVPVGALPPLVRAIPPEKLIDARKPNPLAEQGHKPLPPRIKPLPAPVGPAHGFRLIKSGAARRDHNTIHAEGGVEFEYHGYKISCGTVDGDLGTNVFTLSQDVEIVGVDAAVLGEQVTVDFNGNRYIAFHQESELTPRLVQGVLRGDLYVHGSAASGTPHDIRIIDGGLTTCDLPNPHYELDAHDEIVRPGVRAILRKVRVKFFGKTIFSLPFLSIPLDDRTYNNLPTAGESDDEGYYVKTHFGIPLKGDNEFRARLDYMSKLGVGYGGDYLYQNPTLAGVTRIYAISGMSNELYIANEHRQNFRWGSLSIDNSYQDNYYLTAPGSTVLSTRAVLTVPQGTRATDTLTYTRNSNATSGYSSVNQTVTVDDARRLTRQLNTTTDVSLANNSNSYVGSPSTDTETVDVHFSGTDDFKQGTANLVYQRDIPIGQNANYFNSSDQTPVLTLASDASRLTNKSFAKFLPFRTSLSLGEFGDPTSGSDGHITRTYFDFSFNRPDTSRKRFTADFDGRFQQGLYSDDTAEFVVGTGANLSYRLGKDTSANLRYTYLKPEGYSPLYVDRPGQTHTLTTDISFRPEKYFLLGAQTGFDFLRAETQDVGWQQLGLRGEFQPANYFLMRTLATYDTYDGYWSSVRIDTTYRPGATLFSLGTQYDGYAKKWSNLNVYLNSLKIGRTLFSAVLTYNGLTSQFDATQFNFVYDLHCAEAVLNVSQYNTGFRPGREIQFFVRLKALPFDSLFGLGHRGEPLGTSTGRSF